jgi:N-formylglutamate deformylase
MEIYRLTRGLSPLILSMPHSGLTLPPRLESRLTQAAALLPDTDWHIPKLYGFARELDCTVIQANYSRFVVDLNRPADDSALYPGQASTGLCPEVLFDGSPIYHPGEEPDDKETARRVRQYWQPYHDALAREIERVRHSHGFAVLYDCHSIRSVVPRLFEGTLPVLNLGTDFGKSCAEELQRRIERELEESGYSFAVNGRFVGGYITRHYGQPERNVHALQMELAQSAYMDENLDKTYDPDNARRLAETLNQVLQIILHWTPGQASLV